MYNCIYILFIKTINIYNLRILDTNTNIYIYIYIFGN